MSLRRLPAVHRLMAAVAPHVEMVSPDMLREATRAVLAAARRDLAPGAEPPPFDTLAAAIIAQLRPRPALSAVINGSGVILQTNLGRAPLSQAAREAMSAAAGYAAVEYDLESGQRGSRNWVLQERLCALTGAEGALVVNNAAAALVLSLSAAAVGREVLVARSQAVEIGGGFRIPDVIAQSGCRLLDVGTTNRTYARDYAEAISPATAAILRVHSSNFRLVGFTSEPSLAELASVAHDAALVLIDDLGSGALLDTAQFGLAPEPLVQDSVTSGADLVIFSGDKLLGGPQAGIIVGKADWIKRLARHPLMRALRVDKTILAGLGVTLDAYLRGSACAELPVWQMISATLESLRERGERLVAALGDLGAELIATESAIGGGSLPGATLPSLALCWTPAEPDALAKRLRLAPTPVIARINAGRLLIDLRTVLPDQEQSLVLALRAVLASV